MLIVLSWLIAVPPALLLAWYCLEVLLGLRARRTVVSHAQVPHTTILIPAHNEALNIARTVQQLVDESSAAKLLVVADNCDDDTARLAREAGAAVVERNDAERRGKGYALAFGRDHIARCYRDTEVVVVLDADCRTTSESIRHLATACKHLDAPCQASNLLVADKPKVADATGKQAPPSPLSQISNFAMLIKNLVRARGLQRLGGGIPLFGTGMAFPWRIFAKADLATDHLVEDMQLALDLARRGVRVTLVEEARVESAPAPDDALNAQRSRWEKGFLGTALSQGLPLLLGGLVSASRHRMALGMHLLVPPLALLLMLSAINLVLVAVVGAIVGTFVPAALLAAALFTALAATFLAWSAEGRSTLSAAAALKAPLYVLWKVPLYLGFLKKDRRGWQRTRREGESD